VKLDDFRKRDAQTNRHSGQRTTCAIRYPECIAAWILASRRRRRNFEAMIRRQAAEIPAEFLDGTRVERVFPGGGFLAGLFNPGDGEIHPARFVRGLARAAERDGARIFERTAVTRIEPGAGSTRITRSSRIMAATPRVLMETPKHPCGSSSRACAS